MSKASWLTNGKSEPAAGTLARRIDNLLRWTLGKGNSSRRVKVRLDDVAVCVPWSSPGILRAWTAGLGRPAPDQLVALALACGVAPLWLSTGLPEHMETSRPLVLDVVRKRFAREVSR